MATVGQMYDFDTEIATFFSQTSVSREECDQVAKDLVGHSQVVPVPIQGVCSYTVYVGEQLEFVVQFRLKSLQLKLETVTLARQIYGELVPEVSFRTQLGEDAATAGQEPLLVYVMTRILGPSRLDFIIADKFPDNSPENKARRRNLVKDVARFFATAWKAPQHVEPAYHDHMAETFNKDLQSLLVALPTRFHPIIRATIKSLPKILNLPMVLTHGDFFESNIIVDESSYHLAGVIDWAEAEITPFGVNLVSPQLLMSKLHLRDGYIRYDDYDELTGLFWSTFTSEAGGLSVDTIKTIKAARVLGVLRSKGFTARLGNMATPVPIGDDAIGRYKMMQLDGLLLHPATRFEDMDEYLA
ncbi:hypothetical protein RB601_003951 [Gaeumannomyces tritici]